MSWLDRILPPRINRNDAAHRARVPEGVWIKCPSCDATLYSSELRANLNVCPKCGFHLRMGARARIDSLLDADGRTPIGEQVTAIDPLKFKDSRKYPDRLAEAAAQSGEKEALLVEAGTIRQVPAVVACFEFGFMGGSMGSVVGERFARGVQAAIERRAAFVSVSASGGARMQEGLFSLMQMAKTTSALARLSDERLPYLSVLTDPTMGGVSASFCFLGDVVIAEPRALIGFAGPRVIEQTMRETLPEGFQRAEFLLDKGAIDMIVPRGRLRDEIASMILLLRRQPPAEAA